MRLLDLCGAQGHRIGRGDVLVHQQTLHDARQFLGTVRQAVEQGGLTSRIAERDRRAMEIEAHA